MDFTPEELQSNLDRLRGNLSAARHCTPADGYEAIARRAAEAMPLCHTTSEKSLPAVLASKALLSTDQIRATPRRADVILSGTNDICFYLGSAAFPDREFGFLFSSNLTDSFRGRASSTPFDSGGCVSKSGPARLPVGADGFTHVRTHSMPVPECREYLGDLLGSHFRNTRAYLEGAAFACPCCTTELADPHGMTSLDEHALVRMHEVRIPGRVDLTHPMLVAILAPEGLPYPEFASLVVSGVRLIPYDTSSSPDRTRALRRASVEFILENILN